MAFMAALCAGVSILACTNPDIAFMSLIFLPFMLVFLWFWLAHSDYRKQPPFYP
ncbi:MAG: hypothetical protein ABIY70_25910 [Capsulimonas sp.]|uniref:hypothetical protein n=1 Tax=Capsulimonas sp. TaxID=2494211 RepID=UPI0032665354